MPIPMIPPAIITPSAIAQAGGLTEASSALPPLYVGQVSTRCLVPNSSNTTNKGLGTFKLLFAGDRLTNPKFTFPNYICNANGTITGLGASAALKASVEYPPFSGNRQQILFSGSATGTIPDGLELTSDGNTLTTPIPDGMPYLVWVNWYNAAGIVFSAYNAAAATLVDGLEVSTSPVTDRTMSGSIATNAYNSYGPIAVTQLTRKPSAFLFGDSRYFGINANANDYRADTGEVAKAIGPHCGYINYGVPSVRAYQLVGNTTGLARRVAAAQYCSHIIMGLGINDIAFGGRSAAQVVADLTTLCASFSGKIIIGTTIAPYTTATSDAYLTTGGQTKSGTESVRIAFNDLLRAGIAGQHGVWDVDDACSNDRNSGLWRVSQNRGATTGAAGWGTTDGLHQTAALNDAIAKSGECRLAMVQR